MTASSPRWPRDLDQTQGLVLSYDAGFAVASNRGMALGRGRYILVLNPDTVVVGDAVRTLVEFADSHPDAGVIAPQLRYPDGRPQRTARAFPTAAAGIFGRRSLLTRWFPSNRWSRKFLLESERLPHDHRPFQVDWVSGAAMLVPRCVLDQVGGFDEAFFLFWEDADWCHRIKNAGLAVWCVPTATVIHAEGGTRGSGWDPRTLRSFHVGAYRYWTKHHAPQAWNPLRWAAAVLLLLHAVAGGLRSLLPRPLETRTVPA